MTKIEAQPDPSRRLGKIVAGIPHKIGNGFSANHFSEEMFDGKMDPLLIVDHFVMTAMFEDSVGCPNPVDCG